MACRRPTLRERLDPLPIAALAFLVANVVHTLDHLRQGTERLTAEVAWGGTAISALAVGALVLALCRHPRAPLAAAVIGLSSAFGAAAAHLAPHWSAFSDPYADAGVDALSWAIALAEIGAALALGLIGILRLRRAHPDGLSARA